MAFASRKPSVDLVFRHWTCLSQPFPWYFSGRFVAEGSGRPLLMSASIKSTFSFREFELDPLERRLLRAGESIALTPKVFDTLVFLVERAGRLVSKEELIQGVWPRGFVDESNLTKHIWLIRRALGEADQGAEFIETIPKIGYRFVAPVMRGAAAAAAQRTPAVIASERRRAGYGWRPSLALTTRALFEHCRGRTNRVAIAAAVLVAIAAIVALGMHYGSWNQRAAQPATVAITDKSIAVLPFADMSEKKDQEYFAAGMAEEVIDLLVKIPGLKVISRTSSFQFKEKTQDLSSVGTQLRAAYVLQGSVRKSGDHIRVTAQLINAQDGTHLWAQTYERQLADVLKMQDEIAIALVQALQLEVEAHIVLRPTLRNTEAYTLYLRGLHASSRFDQEGMEQAVSDFERVIELDPSFAPAYLMLGNAYFLLGAYGFMPPAVAFERDRLANERALKVDPNLAMAHAQLGDIHRAYDWDWVAADQELKQALALAPADGDILFYAAVQSLGMGRSNDALKQLDAALAQDPLNPSRYQVLTLIQSSRGRLEEAEAAAHRALELIPMGPLGHAFLGNVLLLRSHPDAALTEFSKEAVEAARVGGIAMAHFAQGRRADSDAALAQMTNRPTDHPFFIARVYAFRGEPNEAVKWLDVAYAQKDSGMLPLIKGDAMFKKIEGNPRYKAFLKKMNLPE
jgi:TolB-like protein/DNA-binding winged helix-turn-helix (wHTH) protein